MILFSIYMLRSGFFSKFLGITSLPSTAYFTYYEENFLNFFKNYEIFLDVYVCNITNKNYYLVQ